MTLKIIRILVVLILVLNVYSWTENINNTNIAYNKYETFLSLKKLDIEASSDIEFLKKEALENIDIIKSSNHQKHKVANLMVFATLPAQAMLILILLMLSFWIKTTKTP